MAFKFASNNTYNMTAFNTWLSTIKDETFLKECEISFEKKSDYDSKITFSKNGVNISVEVKEASNSAFVPVNYNGKYNYNYTGVNFNVAGVHFAGAIINNSGMIIALKSSYTSDTSLHDRFIAITFDDNGELCLIYPNGNINDSVNNATGFRCVTKNSVDANEVILTPRFNGAITSIGNVAANDIYNTTISKGFAAMCTQIATYGIYNVVFGTQSFITNGYFYIQD